MAGYLPSLKPLVKTGEQGAEGDQPLQPRMTGSSDRQDLRRPILGREQAWGPALPVPRSELRWGHGDGLVLRGRPPGE
jgi:hypothetical protein